MAANSSVTPIIVTMLYPTADHFQNGKKLEDLYASHNQNVKNDIAYMLRQRRDERRAFAVTFIVLVMFVAIRLAYLLRADRRSLR